ncbi:hypothetical protein [Nocardioides salsibiostraticola]
MTTINAGGVDFASCAPWFHHELVAHLFASWYAEQLFVVGPHRGD